MSVQNVDKFIDLILVTLSFSTILSLAVWVLVYVIGGGIK